MHSFGSSPWRIPRAARRRPWSVSPRPARWLLAACLALGMASVIAAQSSTQAQRLYEEALERDGALRREMDQQKAGTPNAALLDRVRVLVTTFKDLSRLFPDSTYSDNALWQGATLSAAAFWHFGTTEDREAALALFEELATKFRTSPLAKQVPAETRRLTTAAAAGLPTPSVQPSAPAAPPAARAPIPRPSAPAATSRTAATLPRGSGPGTLRAIRREVLPEVVRITLDLEHEVPFSDEQIAAPSRLFIDLPETAPAPSLRGATIPYADGLVTQIRVGLPVNSRTRVVLDLARPARYSVYALYNPFRIVIDIERAMQKPAASTIGTAIAAAASPSATAPSTSPVAPAVPAALPPALASAGARTGGGVSLSRQLGLGVSRVVIDPGHGGQDPGARGRGLSESAIVLDVALRLEKLLLKQQGVEVILTRRTNGYVSLEERTAIANRAEADLFLSIHANASANLEARGVETYFLNFAPNKEAEAIAARENAGSTQTMARLPDIVRAIAFNNKIDESRHFASILQASLYENLRKTNRTVRNLGVKQAPFMVLIGATMPSALAEISFLTNKQDADLLKTERYRQQIAEALLAGIIRYQESLKRATRT